MMEEGMDDIPQNPSVQIVDVLYNQSTEHLKTRVSFVFKNNKLHPNNWAILTWAKHVKRSMIEAKGTAEDKANLPDKTRFNQGHTGRKQKVQLQKHIRVAQRRV